MNISKNQFKLITSLSQKKYRHKYKLFIAEGVKVVNELLKSNLELTQLFCTKEFLTTVDVDKKIQITQEELKKISKLKSPNQVLAIFRIPFIDEVDKNNITLVLDDINDPGNLGTIIRLCDWFDIKSIVCSLKTVDCYNQKVVQASMGSLTRVNIVYTDLKKFITNSSLPVFIADMDGENIYKAELPKKVLLIMGNEANGVSVEIKNLVKNKISIPQFGENHSTESLNVATATAIIFSEFKRNL